MTAARSSPPRSHRSARKQHKLGHVACTGACADLNIRPAGDPSKHSCTRIYFYIGLRRERNTNPNLHIPKVKILKLVLYTKMSR